MNAPTPDVEGARRAALEVLIHNAHGPFQGLPRTAGWGYPEPYTRDLMIGAFGILVTGNEALTESLRRVLQELARHQTPRGHIPSLVHDPGDLGASDTTPLFLIGLALFRQATGEADFLSEAADRALTWLEYQSPDDRVLVAQQPTSDWRDEQWVFGHGLFVNTLVYCAFHLHHRSRQSQTLRQLINSIGHSDPRLGPAQPQGLNVPGQPYYALWAYKIHRSERFDLLGNALAILSGIAPPARAQQILAWIEAQCLQLRAQGELGSELPPCLLPYIRPHDSDWHPRYEAYNRPGTYHNGGIWPFICAFYIAALVANQQFSLAEEKLLTLTELVRPARNHDLAFGFNEWFRAQDASPQGEDWQSWSAAMYLYAADAVAGRRTRFFDKIRQAGANGPDV